MRIGRRQGRVIAVSIAATAAALATILTITAPAHADSGGGCTTRSGGGFTVGACIYGDRLTAVSDMYVDKIGYKGEDCFITISQGDPSNEEWYPCQTGHYYGPSVGGVLFYASTYVGVSVNGNVVLTVTSSSVFIG